MLTQHNGIMLIIVYTMIHCIISTLKPKPIKFPVLIDVDHGLGLILCNEQSNCHCEEFVSQNIQNNSNLSFQILTL
jgi:hypothetical protein